MSALWDEVCRLYEAPGVRDLCLRLQDAHGVDVPLLLTVAALAKRGIALDRSALDALTAASEPWQRAVVAALRAARHALRDGADAGAALGAEADTLRSLKAAVQAAELAAERVEIDALERASAAWTRSGDGGSPAAAVARLLARDGVELAVDELAAFAAEGTHRV